jgi:hypothetical protein
MKTPAKLWERKCPNCKSLVYHTSKCNRDRLERNKCLCTKCIGKSQRLFPDVVNFTRTCRECGGTITYKNRTLYNQAHKRNSRCKNCVLVHRCPCKEETKHKISEKNSGERNGMWKSKPSPERRKQLSDYLIAHPIRSNSLKSIEKMRCSLRRLYATRYIETGGKNPKVNTNACKFIDKWGKDNGYNFVHGLNGGEFYVKEAGCWLDGYDIGKNVAFEYDEKHHFNIDGLLRKDINRMMDIMNAINCVFVRYNEKEKITIFYEMTNGILEHKIL